MTGNTPEKIPSDPTQLKIENSQNAMIQNLAIGLFLTIGYVTALMYGDKAFDARLYVGSLLLGFGVINGPAWLGKGKAGSLGGFTLLATMPKHTIAMLAAGYKSFNG